jgi:hypothetical protein
MRRVRQWGWG